MADSVETDGFPSELQDRLANFDDSLAEVEEILKPLHDVPIHELQAKMTALDRAKLDLLGAYTMNSLFWVFLSTKGENPKEHGIKQELERIRTYMGRVKEIEDRAKAPKLDKGAAKRFVRNALWQQAHQKKSDTESMDTSDKSGEASTSGETNAQTERGETPAKIARTEDSTPSPGPKKHKKKKKNRDKR